MDLIPTSIQGTSSQHGRPQNEGPCDVDRPAMVQAKSQAVGTLMEFVSAKPGGKDLRSIGSCRF